MQAARPSTATTARPAALPPQDASDAKRIVKTFKPLQPGTLKLVERYGAALVCTRHREDAAGTTRTVTVELVVETGATRRRLQDGQTVDVRIEWREATLRSRAKTLGATLDPATALWRMPYRAARILGRERPAPPP